MQYKFAIGAVTALCLLGFLALAPKPSAPLEIAHAQDSGAVGVASGSVGADVAVANVAAPAERTDVSEREQVSEEPRRVPPGATVVVVRLVDAESGEPIRGYGLALRHNSAITDLGAVDTFVRTDARGSVRFEDP